MSKHYEALTKLIPTLEKDAYGTWNFQQNGDGSKEDPFTIPFASLSPAALSLLTEIGKIIEQHPEFDCKNYKGYLTKRGYISKEKVPFPIDEIRIAPIENMDIEDIIVMFFAVQRSDRFCEGLLLSFFKDGTILKWLKRIEELDGENE